MTEMQAAQGIRWYEKLPEWTAIRNRNAKMYDEVLGRFSCIRLTLPPNDCVHAYYKYYCFVRPETLKSGWDRDRIASEISKRGVPCFSGSCWNISEEKCFKDKGWSKAKDELPNAYALKDTSLMLLVHPTITVDDMLFAQGVIEDVLSHAQK